MLHHFRKYLDVMSLYGIKQAAIFPAGILLLIFSEVSMCFERVVYLQSHNRIVTRCSLFRNF